MAKKSGTKKSLKISDLKPHKDAKGGTIQQDDSSKNPQRILSKLTGNP
jgi:hypothetical protein